MIKNNRKEMKRSDNYEDKLQTYIMKISSMDLNIDEGSKNI